jgi:hypothetical protein
VRDRPLDIPNFQCVIELLDTHDTGESRIVSRDSEFFCGYEGGDLVQICPSGVPVA